jgi:hypothetical protein
MLATIIVACGLPLRDTVCRCGIRFAAAGCGSQSTLPRVTVEVPDARLEAQGLKRTGVDTTYELIGHKRV